MKFSVNQLNKYQNNPLFIDEMIDINYLVTDSSEIIRIHPIHLKGSAKCINFERYEIELRANITIVMECSISLQEVEVPLKLELYEIFSEDKEEDETRKIEKGKIDIDELVFEFIILEKPMKVTAKGVTLDQYVKQDSKQAKNKHNTEKNNPFSKLSDLLDENK